jgi:isftu1 transposase
MYVGRVCDWLQRDSLELKQHRPRRRKLDRQARARHIEEHPNLLPRERPVHLGVRIHSIQYTCKQLRISHKKRCATPNETMSNAWPVFARSVRLSASAGHRAWCISMKAALRRGLPDLRLARKGKQVYGERSGNAWPRTSLIAAQCGNRLLAPVLFKGATNSVCFNHWLKHCLFPELPAHATFIMDNATFHKTPQTRIIIGQSPYQLLHLPNYSPDLKPIERVFANLKKRRQHASI